MNRRRVKKRRMRAAWQRAMKERNMHERIGRALTRRGMMFENAHKEQMDIVRVLAEIANEAANGDEFIAMLQNPAHFAVELHKRGVRVQGRGGALRSDVAGQQVPTQADDELNRKRFSPDDDGKFMRRGDDQ